MRFLLDQPHYVDDKILDAGLEIGDGENAVHDWRYLADNKVANIKAGTLRPLSVNMTPLDDEARAKLREFFGTEAPEKDPTKAIPLQGTGSQAKVPPLAPKISASKPTVAPAKAEPQKG